MLAPEPVPEQNLCAQDAPDFGVVEFSVFAGVIAALVCHTLLKSPIAIVYLSGTSTAGCQ